MRDDGSGSSPYGAQTAANTNVDWPDSIDNVKADFGSMATYAENMYNASMDLLNSTGPFQNHMAELATAGFFNVGEGTTIFPEATVAHRFVSANNSDFLAMLHDLQVSMQNIGYAAQTISDAYGLTDGASASDLNAITVDGVDFAFGRGGERPKGLDSHVGQTYQDCSRPPAARRAPTRRGPATPPTRPCWAACRPCR